MLDTVYVLIKLNFLALEKNWNDYSYKACTKLIIIAMISKNVCKLLGYQWRAVCFRSSHPSFPLVSFHYQPPLSRALACRQYTLMAWKKVLSCILAWQTGCWSIYRLEWQPYKPHNNKILFPFLQPHKEAAAETEKWLKWDCKSTLNWTEVITYHNGHHSTTTTSLVATSIGWFNSKLNWKHSSIKIYGVI